MGKEIKVTPGQVSARPQEKKISLLDSIVGFPIYLSKPNFGLERYIGNPTIVSILCKKGYCNFFNF